MKLSKNERLLVESCCDGLAMEIDEREGKVPHDELKKAIHRAAKTASVSQKMFLAIFEELYMCSPFVYAQNSLEDAAAERRIEEFKETSCMDVFDHAEEGVTPVDDEEF